MASVKSRDIAARAQEIYESQLKAQLEKSALHQFVAIEPDSGDYFLGNTLSEAIQSARKKYPDRLAFALRVGHATAVHLGASSSQGDRWLSERSTRRDVPF